MSDNLSVQKPDFTLTPTPEEFQELLDRLPTAEFTRIGLQAIAEDPNKYMMAIVLGDEIKTYVTLSDLLACISKSLVFLSPDVPTT